MWAILWRYATLLHAKTWLGLKHPYCKHCDTESWFTPTGSPYLLVTPNYHHNSSYICRSHLYRKHKNDLTVRNQSSSSSDAAGADSENIVDDDQHDESDDPMVLDVGREELQSNCPQLEKSALFLLKAREERMITQVTLNMLTKDVTGDWHMSQYNSNQYNACILELIMHAQWFLYAYRTCTIWGCKGWPKS